MSITPCARGPANCRRWVKQYSDHARAAWSKLRAWRLHLQHIPPNLAFRRSFRPGDAAIDVGTGDNPELSKYLIARYRIDCFAVDPTRKHAGALMQLQRSLPGFHFLPYALGTQAGQTRFYESQVNVSGSALLAHRNVRSDPLSIYDVDTVTLAQLLDLVGREEIALLKLDCEGLEYDIIRHASSQEWKRIRQVIVEFHHDIVDGMTWADTRDAIDLMQQLGMNAILYNGRDCLFYW